MINFIRGPGSGAPRSLLVSQAITVIIFLFSWLVVRPLQKAVLVSFVWLVLFFTYGHLFAQVDNLQVWLAASVFSCRSGWEWDS